MKQIVYHGKVIAIKYSEGDEHPHLHIDTRGYSSDTSPDKFAIINPELMKKIHRTLATGDVVECQVRKNRNRILELVNFGIIQEHQPKQGEVRKLLIDHWEGQFGTLGIAGAEPDEIDMSDADWDVLEQGDYVYNLSWDAQYQGGNGVESIVRLGSAYYHSGDSGVFGPFSSLGEALKWSELDTFTSVTESIDCSEMDSETLANLLQPQDDVEPGFKLEINGEEWEVSEQGTLRMFNTIDKQVDDQRIPIDLKLAMKLNGIQDWELTPPQHKFLIQSTENLLQEHPPEWFQENQDRLKEELEIVFKEI